MVVTRLTLVVKKSLHSAVAASSINLLALFDVLTKQR